MTWLQTPGGGLQTPIGLGISTSSGWFFALLCTAANAREGKEHWGSAQIVRPPIRVRDAQCTCQTCRMEKMKSVDHRRYWGIPYTCLRVEHMILGLFDLFGFFLGRFWGIDRYSMSASQVQDRWYIYIWCIIKIVIIMTIVTIMVVI